MAATMIAGVAPDGSRVLTDPSSDLVWIDGRDDTRVPRTAVTASVVWFDEPATVPDAAVVASAVLAGLVPDGVVEAPMNPPKAWLTEPHPDWDPAGPLIQVFDGGQVTALVAPYDECIIGGGHKGCFTPPVSRTNYEYAHVGQIVTADGDTVRVANIGGSVDHFDMYQPLAVDPASSHYANTATRRMIGRYIDHPPHGIVFCGQLYPGLTHAQVFEVITSALSGDWRWVESMADWEMVGSQLVNNPGFRPNPLKTRPQDFAGAKVHELAPTRRMSVAGFYGADRKALVASLTDSVAPCDSKRVVSQWITSPEADPAPQVALPAGWRDRLVAKVASLEADVLQVYDGAVVDVDMDDEPDGDDGEDYADELTELDSDACAGCAGHGCEHCKWVGYMTMPTAIVAALEPLHAAWVAAVKRPRDGDGDGFVYDGTPRMRPYNPLTDLGPLDPPDKFDDDVLEAKTKAPKPTKRQDRATEVLFSQLQTGDVLADINGRPLAVVESIEKGSYPPGKNTFDTKVDVSPYPGREADLDPEDLTMYGTAFATPGQQSRTLRWDGTESVEFTPVLPTTSSEPSANPLLTDGKPKVFKDFTDIGELDSFEYTMVPASKLKPGMVLVDRDLGTPVFGIDARVKSKAGSGSADWNVWRLDGSADPMGQGSFHKQSFGANAMVPVAVRKAGSSDPESLASEPLGPTADDDNPGTPEWVTKTDLMFLDAEESDMEDDWLELRDRYNAAADYFDAQGDADKAAEMRAEAENAQNNADTAEGGEDGLGGGEPADPADQIPDVPLTLAQIAERDGKVMVRVTGGRMKNYPKGTIVELEPKNDEYGWITTIRPNGKKRRDAIPWKHFELAPEGSTPTPPVPTGQAKKPAGAAKPKLPTPGYQGDWWMENYGREYGLDAARHMLVAGTAPDTLYPPDGPADGAYHQLLRDLNDRYLADPKAWMDTRTPESFAQLVAVAEQLKAADAESDPAARALEQRAAVGDSRWAEILGRVGIDDYATAGYDERRWVDRLVAENTGDGMDARMIRVTARGLNVPGGVTNPPGNMNAKGWAFTADALGDDDGSFAAAAAAGESWNDWMRNAATVEQLERLDGAAVEASKARKATAVHRNEARDQVADPWARAAFDGFEVAVGDTLGGVTYEQMGNGDVRLSAAGYKPRAYMRIGTDGTVRWEPSSLTGDTPPTVARNAGEVNDLLDSVAAYFGNTMPSPEPPAPATPPPVVTQMLAELEGTMPWKPARSYGDADIKALAAWVNRDYPEALAAIENGVAVVRVSSRDASEPGSSQQRTMLRVELGVRGADGTWVTANVSAKGMRTRHFMVGSKGAGWRAGNGKKWAGDGVMVESGHDGLSGFTPDTPDAPAKKSVMAEPNPNDAWKAVWTPNPLGGEWEQTRKGTNGFMRTVVSQETVQPGYNPSGRPVGEPYLMPDAYWETDGNPSVDLGGPVYMNDGEDYDAFVNRALGELNERMRLVAAGKPLPEPEPTPEPEATPDAGDFGLPPTGTPEWSAALEDAYGKFEGVKKGTPEYLAAADVLGRANRKLEAEWRAEGNDAQADWNAAEAAKYEQIVAVGNAGKPAGPSIEDMSPLEVRKAIYDYDNDAITAAVKALFIDKGQDMDIGTAAKLSSDPRGFIDMLGSENNRLILGKLGGPKAAPVTESTGTAGDLVNEAVELIDQLDVNAPAGDRTRAIAEWVAGGIIDGKFSADIADVVVSTAQQQSSADISDVKIEALNMGAYLAWRRTAEAKGHVLPSPKFVTDKDAVESGQLSKFGLSAYFAKKYGVKYGKAATPHQKHGEAVFESQVAESPVFAAQVAAWGSPRMVAFSKGSKGTAWASGSQLIGWSKTRTQNAEKRAEHYMAQLRARGVDINHGDPPRSQAELRKMLKDAGVSFTDPLVHHSGKGMTNVKSIFGYLSWNSGHDGPNFMRHEYGHIVDARLKRAKLREAQRTAFRKFVAEHHSVVREVSDYARTNPNELFAEFYAVVTHPRFAERTGYSPEAEQAFSLFLELIEPIDPAPLGAVGAPA